MSPPAILVMGTSGCGKSTLGRAIAADLGATFLEGDEYHTDEARARMARGEPLTDADRWPWLDRLAAAVADTRRDGPVVFACSALKRSYRDRLRARLPGLVTVFPMAPRDVIAERMAERTGHYMPVSLLDSQFAALEPPEEDEAPVRVDATLGITPMIERAVAALRDRPGV